MKAKLKATNRRLAAMTDNALMRRCSLWFMTHRQTDGFVPNEALRRLRAGKAADLVRQRFQPDTQAFAGIYVFKHQLLVALDEARVYTRQCFLKS